MSKKHLTHVAGTFLIQADGSFLNGAGLGDGEDRNETVPKTFQDGKKRVPYVSSQAWKRWLRNTLIEETGWPASEIKAIDKNAQGNTNKVSGSLNPIVYAEDDIFGYMRAAKGQGKNGTFSVMRTSPLVASLLVSLRNTGWLGKDQGAVYPKDGTPLLYSSQFYNTNLQGVFNLNYSRLGTFANIGDRYELDPELIDEAVRNERIKIVQEQIEGTIYELANAEELRKQRASALIHSLSVLRGGAKQAAFGTDVAPKVLLMAGLTSGNPIFNHLFKDNGEGPYLHISVLQEVLEDYSDYIVTPVWLGIRSNFLMNEQEIRDWVQNWSHPTIQVELCSPVQAAQRFTEWL